MRLIYDDIDNKTDFKNGFFSLVHDQLKSISFRNKGSLRDFDSSAQLQIQQKNIALSQFLGRISQQGSLGTILQQDQDLSRE